jgi:hypothetical protein
MKISYAKTILVVSNPLGPIFGTMHLLSIQNQFILFNNTILEPFLAFIKYLGDKQL